MGGRGRREGGEGTGGRGRTEGGGAASRLPGQPPIPGIQGDLEQRRWMQNGAEIPSLQSSFSLPLNTSRQKPRE